MRTITHKTKDIKTHKHTNTVTPVPPPPPPTLEGYKDFSSCTCRKQIHGTSSIPPPSTNNTNYINIQEPWSNDFYKQRWRTTACKHSIVTHPLPSSSQYFCTALHFSNFYYLLNTSCTPCGNFRSPYLGTATEATRIARYLFLAACAVFLCTNNSTAASAWDF